MKKYKVGVIGNGFVGESQAFAFSPTCDILIYDKNPLKSVNSIEEASSQLNSLLFPIIASIGIIVALQITIIARRR